MLGNGPAFLGHAPTAVIDAVAATLSEGQVFAAQHPRETELAERLVRLLPSSEVVRFATSGTEAVLMAFRLARAFTGRTKILKFEGHYHGWSDQAYISARPPLNEAGRLTRLCLSRARPACRQRARGYRRRGLEQSRTAAQAFERHKGEIAAIIMEPVMVNAGPTEPEPGYLEGVRDLCREQQRTFICDEVITGFRAGLRGAQGRYGVTAISRSTPRPSLRASRSPWWRPARCHGHPARQGRDASRHL